MRLLGGLPPGDEDLRTCAPKVWRTIREAPLEPPIRATLERILECWLIERFPLLTNEELRTMLPVLVPLEQTRVYQEIFAKGEAEGKADGLKRQLTRRFGALPQWAVQRLDAATMEQLDGWLEGIFDAQSLEGLLGPKPRRAAAKRS